MARRSSSIVSFLLALAALLAVAPAAMAGTTPTIQFGHDDTRDGNPALEIHSGLFSAFGYDASLQPDAQRADSTARANAAGGTSEANPTYEKFPFDVPAGDENGSFTVAVTWQEPAVDLDVYVYRQRPNGTLDPSAVAQSASVADPEKATRFEPIAGDPIKPGRYWVFVDNWCSNDSDPLVVRFLGGSCTGGAPLSNVDEDDFVGQVTFTPFSTDNQSPSASLSGPDTGSTGEALTFTAAGADPDGQIRSYAFDLDGDGRFEYDNGASGTVSKRFDAPGSYNVGVRVADDRGGTAYASKLVKITGPAVPVSAAAAAKAALTKLSLVRSFTLDRPVFGGEKARRLTVRYRLRAPAKVTLTLYRGKTRIKRLDSRTARADRTYRLLVSAKNRKRGTYSVHLVARSTDGKITRTAQLTATRL